jgi:O-antigen/teichoic acid export membrane protein
MLVAQGAKLVLTIGSVAVLARLLTPSDFGLVAMVTAITTLVVHLKDLGLSGATIQKPEVNHEQISTLFWVNVGFGWLLALCIALLAPALARFYGEPRLVPITLALSLLFVFAGFAIQHRALLRRRMRFGALALADLVSTALGIVVAIVAAIRGHRYWALVLMQLTTAASLAIGLWIACGWRPGWPARSAGVRSMLAFGGNLTGANLLNAATRQLDKVLLGWAWGAGPLGLYSKSFQLLQLPFLQVSRPLSNVAVPALSRLQHDPQRYRSFYQQGLQIMAALGMPIVVFIFVATESVVLAVLGPQWDRCVPIFRLLAPAAFMGSFNMATGWLYISLGHTARQFRWVTFSSAVIALAMIIGVRWGAVGVAAAFSIALCGLRLPDLMYCVAVMPVTLRDIMSVLWRPAAASVAAGGLLSVIQRLVGGTGTAVLDLIVALAIFTPAYVVCWLLLPEGRRKVRDALRLLAELKPATLEPPATETI